MASMNGLSVKLPAELHTMLSKEARRRNVSRSSLVRELIANALRDRGDAPPPSCADLAGDLIGAVRSGRSDLATNTRLLDEAVVQDSHLAGTDRHR
jgi:hypothetical protein